MLLSSIWLKTLFVSGIVLFVASDDDKTKPLFNLNGDWRVTKAFSYGADVTDDLSDVIFRVQDDKCEFVKAGLVLKTFRWKRNEVAAPHRLDIEYIGNDANAKKEYEAGIKAIYRIVDGKLERCYSDPGKARPTTFESTSRNGQTLMITERVNPK